MGAHFSPFNPLRQRSSEQAQAWAASSHLFGNLPHRSASGPHADTRSDVVCVALHKATSTYYAPPLPQYYVAPATTGK